MPDIDKLILNGQSYNIVPEKLATENFTFEETDDGQLALINNANPTNSGLNFTANGKGAAFFAGAENDNLLRIGGGTQVAGQHAQLQIKNSVYTSSQSALAVTDSYDNSIFLMYGSSGNSGLYHVPADDSKRHWVICDYMDDSHIEIPKPLRVEGHSSAIGTTLAFSGTFAPSGKDVTGTILTFDLPAGTWEISCYVGTEAIGTVEFNTRLVDTNVTESSIWRPNLNRSIVTMSGGAKNINFSVIEASTTTKNKSLKVTSGGQTTATFPITFIGYVACVRIA